MNATEEKLYVELRQTEQEILVSLTQRQKNDWLKSILEEELTDIRLAIDKVENGCYGQCELSGELFPEEFLKIMPTAKTRDDFQKVGSFYRKPIH